MASKSAEAGGIEHGVQDCADEDGVTMVVIICREEPSKPDDWWGARR